MGREIRRVIVGFDWPIGTVWAGFQNPHYTAKPCARCNGTGQSLWAKQYSDEWYGNAPFNPASTGSRKFGHYHPVVQELAKRNVCFDYETGAHREPTADDLLAIDREARRLARDCFDNHWSHHLAQEDVDALVDAGRLMEFTHRPRTEEQKAAHEQYQRENPDKGTYWMPESNGYRPTAAEVNEWSLRGFGHDSSNQWLCVKARCARHGVPTECASCKGEAQIWPSKAAKYLFDKWERIPPPEGDGWQLWSTTTAGTPMTPSFATPEELARYCANENVSTFGKDTADYATWLAFITGPGWAPSAVLTGGKLQSGVDAAVEVG